MLFMTELCSCRSTKTLSHDSHDTIQSVSMTIDSVIKKDSVVITFEKRNDTIIENRKEFHDMRQIRTINNSDKKCSTDTLKTVVDKPEPKARSTLQLFEKGGIKTRIRGFMIVIGVMFIILIIIKIRLH
jgi:Fe2+ transport system protein B